MYGNLSKPLILLASFTKPPTITDLYCNNTACRHVAGYHYFYANTSLLLNQLILLVAHSCIYRKIKKYVAQKRTKNTVKLRLN